jgi:hypothetical protein
MIVRPYLNHYLYYHLFPLPKGLLLIGYILFMGETDQDISIRRAKRYAILGGQPHQQG